MCVTACLEQRHVQLQSGSRFKALKLAHARDVGQLPGWPATCTSRPCPAGGAPFSTNEIYNQGLYIEQGQYKNPLYCQGYRTVHTIYARWS